MPLLEQLIDPNGDPIPCFVINLDRSRTRLDKFVRRAAEHSLTCTRIKGVDGRRKEELSIISRNDFVNMTNAEIGCVASHLVAINTAFEAGLNYAIIFEDDTTFTFVNKWPRHVVTKLLTDLPSYVGIVQLYWSQTHANYADIVSPEYLNHGVYCPMASAYIITKKGMVDILSVSKRANNAFQLVKSKPFQSKGHADIYLFDLTYRVTSSLPLFSIDITLESEIQEIKPEKNTDHGSYKDVTNLERLYLQVPQYKRYQKDYVYDLCGTVMGLLPKTKLLYARNYHVNKYPHSLAALYLNKTQTYGDIDAFVHVMHTFIKTHECRVPSKQSVVVHLTLGDVIDKAVCTVDQHLSGCIENVNKVNSVKYVQPLQYFENVLNKVPRFYHVVIMYSTVLGHRVLESTKSREYVLKVKVFIESMGFTCEVKPSMSADEDFVFISMAPLLVTSGGNLATMLKLVHNNLNTLSTHGST